MLAGSSVKRSSQAKKGAIVEAIKAIKAKKDFDLRIDSSNRANSQTSNGGVRLVSWFG